MARRVPPSPDELSRALARARRRELLNEHPRAAAVLEDAGFARRLGLTPGLLILRAHWGAVAGEALAAQTIPWALRDGVLSVRCLSPLYRQELTYAAPSILRIARDHLGDGAVHTLKAVA